MSEAAIRTTCAYCGVGCGIVATPTGPRSVTIRGDEAHPANAGRLCSKGTHLGETVGLEGRLLHPMIGKKRATWDKALNLVADRFRETIARHGPDSVAFYVSGQLLTEDYYVANKLMKGFIGSANIDTDKHPLVMAAKAELDQANSDVSDTFIRAPADGVVTRVSQLQPGSYVQPSQTMFWIISGKPWVDAAFKENQLADLRPGQPVQVHVDAFPNAHLTGHVVSFSPGTGASFAVLPAENASGNWVRVVQRLNVRIELDNPPPEVQLAVGLSATATVDTRKKS